VIGTLRRDCFDHIIVKDEKHAERAPHDYLAYYHGRPHRGLQMQPPTAPGTCRLLARQREPESLESRSSAVCIIATAFRWLHAPHRRRKSVPLERRMQYLLPTGAATFRWALFLLSPISRPQERGATRDSCHAALTGEKLRPSDDTLPDSTVRTRPIVTDGRNELLPAHGRPGRREDGRADAYANLWDDGQTTTPAIRREAIEEAVTTTIENDRYYQESIGVYTVMFVTGNFSNAMTVPP